MSDSTAQRSRWEANDDAKANSGKKTEPSKRTKRKAESISDESRPQQDPKTEDPNLPAETGQPYEIPPTHINNKEHLSGCRSIECYERLNKIEEGTYGVVYRARDLATNEIVALKHLKLETERNGFPITSLREIHTLLLAKHPNIVNVREIVVGRSLNSIYMVMDYMEHDLRTLMESMEEPFGPSEIKSLMLQLINAVAHLHSNWLVHRDLKTSNLLMSGGHLCVADFGLARKYGSPRSNMTGLVVTLWYRAPELLLGDTKYSTSVDMWSVGCIFAEFFSKTPIFPGRGEIDQITMIFKALGTPTTDSWPGFSSLPNAKMFRFSVPDANGLLRRKMQGYRGLTDNAFDLLQRLLTLDPERRITAEEVLGHPYFAEAPPPKHPSMFPTWPTKDQRRQ
ncbi:hypothetical protein GGI25_005560 [Coemansia spiralis]|uniref:cyclin-dependent kinase n=2 Tax=Coemansia TaxID=4863 RepID=A0A9W8FYF7_9FUNG|nr:kinase-like domain-containing protein [Coemansia spiralis]KAJ1987846.1 hypothetical protein EDC05_005627 [Coemansia umbellata]KAJ2622645.1 hypothetical protein GGI26_003091 [Coemansia sp. RSA 1358]KAJ2671287.1 hypothetical protein GGI25_005560 [Coemansia spiralis]